MLVDPNPQACVSIIRKTEEKRLELNLNDLHSTDFDDLIRMNCFVDPGSYDKEGRPILFLLMRNFNLRNISVEHFVRYWVYVSDRASVRMQNCTDELQLVVDFRGFGLSQLYSKHYKAAISMLQEIYPGRSCFIKVINGGRILQAVKPVIYKFFTESAKENI